MNSTLDGLAGYSGLIANMNTDLNRSLWRTRASVDLVSHQRSSISNLSGSLGTTLDDIHSRLDRLLRSQYGYSHHEPPPELGWQDTQQDLNLRTCIGHSSTCLPDRESTLCI